MSSKSPDHDPWPLRFGWFLDRWNRRILRQGRGAISIHPDKPFKLGPRIERFEYTVGNTYSSEPPYKKSGAWFKFHFGNWVFVRPLSLRRHPGKKTYL